MSIQPRSGSSQRVPKPALTRTSHDDRIYVLYAETQAGEDSGADQLPADQLDLIRGLANQLAVGTQGVLQFEIGGRRCNGLIAVATSTTDAPLPFRPTNGFADAIIV